VCNLIKSSAVIGIKLDPDSQIEDCTICKQAKATHLPLGKIKVNLTAKNFGDVIHTDVWGKAPSATRQGRNYFITFTDEATRYTVTYLLRTKSEAFDAYKSFEAWAITQQHCTAIKVLHSDCGGEYLSGAFDKHLAKAGTVRRLTTHDTPQLNGIAERLNRTLMERVRALNHSSGLPTSLWGEALRHATWLKNRSATHKLDGKTPFEALYGRPPNLSTLRIWGSPVWVHNATRSKFDARAREARWIGPDVNAKAHCIFWPRLGNVTVKRNVYFRTSAQLEGEEDNLPVTDSEQPNAPPSPSNSNITIMPETPTIEDADNEDDEPEAEQQQQQQQQKPPEPPRRSGRISKPLCIICDLQSRKSV
jgi:transposase InsO family protein